MTGRSGRTIRKALPARAVQQAPRPLADIPRDLLAGLSGVLFDIDETLTTEGRLTAAAYGALERLHDAGLLTVPITGRPAGWCDHIARMWPVDAVVGENGAFYFRYDGKSRRLLKRFMADEKERTENRRRLAALRDRILSDVQGTGLASDQPYREADLAIDICEDVTPLSRAGVDRILAIFEAAGARAKVSSIHVNGWFGDYDKLSMTKLLFAEHFGIDLDEERAAFLFVGDSPNDAPMFAHFPSAVGVANLLDSADRLTAWPAFMTEARSGAGFAELAEAVLAARAAL